MFILFFNDFNDLFVRKIGIYKKEKRKKKCNENGRYFGLCVC